MTKEEWELRERALTLYSTGRFDKKAAMEEAIAQKKRENQKRKEANDLHKNGIIPIHYEESNNDFG